MCGIVGYIGTKPYNLDNIKLLMIWNFKDRGKDSTGFWTPQTGIVKDIISADKFLIKERLPESNRFIGHVRAGTIGGITLKNTHPHEIKNNNKTIIGVHNGTYRKYEELLKWANISDNDIGSDSEALFKVLSIKNAKDVFPEFKGGCAVLYTWNNEDIFYVYRNTDRTLFHGRKDEGMYISSIEDSLSVIGCSNVKPFKEHNLYTIKNGNIISTIKIEEPMVDNEVPKYNYVPYYRSSLYDYDYYDKPKSSETLKELLRHKGWWVRVNMNSYFLSKGEWVKIERESHISNRNGFDYLVVVKENGNKEIVSANYLDIESIRYTPGKDKIVVLNDLKNTANGEKIMSKGDIFVINDVFNNNGGSKVTVLKNNELWSIDIYNVRKLMPDEEEVDNSDILELYLEEIFEKNKELVVSIKKLNSVIKSKKRDDKFIDTFSKIHEELMNILDLYIAVLDNYEGSDELQVLSRRG